MTSRSRVGCPTGDKLCVKAFLSCISGMTALVLIACMGGSATPGASAASGLQSHRVAAVSLSTRDQAIAAAAGGRLIAPATACPDQEDLGASAADQEQAMGCMVNFARRDAGLNELADADALTQSALDKSEDVLRCDSFSHFACGREFTYWMKQTGYVSTPCWRVGENLAWGIGEYGTVRSIFIAWMRSPDHRANVLGDFDETGLSLRAGTLEGRPGVRVWAEHFGTHCDGPGQS